MNPLDNPTLNNKNDFFKFLKSSQYVKFFIKIVNLAKSLFRDKNRNVFIPYPFVSKL